jgi:RNA polymerase subunit RPABC4/transcription elongation factor Spt4
MLFTYMVCTTCESLFSPELKACPVCGTAVEAETERHVYRILPHVVCNNCGTLVTKEANACPFCETPINQSDIHKIVEQPVELEILV